MRPLPIIASLLFATSLVAEEKKEPEEKKPAIKQINENEFQIGKIHLNKKTREISFGAGVNMTKGLLEYALVTTKSDKVHETLFLSDISPLNLNIALKLLGVNESKELFQLRDENYRPTGKYPKVDQKIREASLVDLSVEWEKDGKKTTAPITDLIHHIQWPEDDARNAKPQQELTLDDVTLTTMPAGPWLSTGSYIHKGAFKAEVTGMMFAIYTTEQAVVNYAGKDRELGDVWIPNAKIIPPVDTEVRIIIKPHTPKS